MRVRVLRSPGVGAILGHMEAVGRLAVLFASDAREHLAEAVILDQVADIAPKVRRQIPAMAAIQHLPSGYLPMYQDGKNREISQLLPWRGAG